MNSLLDLVDASVFLGYKHEDGVQCFIPSYLAHVTVLFTWYLIHYYKQ